MTAADAIGARAMLVHAIDEDAVAFYRKFGFEPSPLDPKQLMLLMKVCLPKMLSGANAFEISDIGEDEHQGRISRAFRT